jgi:hypothetical protein
VTPPTSFAEHAVPPGRARTLAVVVAVAPSDEKRHAVEIAAEEILSAEESEAEGADGGGRGGRPGKRGPSAERPTPNAQRPNDARPNPPAEFGLPGVLPPGASDAEIAETLQRAFAEAAARAIAEEGEDEDDDDGEEEEEEEDVVIVGEVGPSGGAGDAAGAKKAGARAGRRWAGATAPPPRLATLFAHAVASDSALRIAREAMRRRGGCER